MSKKSFIDAIKVKNPCSEDWNEMTGNDRVRFCSHCAKSVNNLSEMTRKEVVRLVRHSGGNLCVRYVKDMRTNSPLFASTLHQIARRTGVAAGVLGASVLLTGAAFAQGGIADPPIVQTEQRGKMEGATSSISGYVTDPNGAVIPYALVSLINQETSEYKTVNASDAGFYEFNDLNQGKYTLRIEAGGFEAKEMSGIYLSDASQIRHDAQLGLPPVAEVVQVGFDENIETVVTVGEITLETRNALIQAILSEDFENVKARIMMRAKINVKDKAYDGITPLHAAVETGNIEIVQFLLSHGAKPNIRDFQKRTPLMMLDYDASPELFQLLLSYGAKMNLVDKHRNTVLHHFAEFDGKSDLLRTMITHGVNVNAQNKEGKTALMAASENGSTENVRALLESGTNINLSDRENKTAWDLADSSAIKELLETFGAVAKRN